MTFVPGKSGNPRGRPKEDPALKAMCQAKTKAAVERLIKEMTKGDTSSARISAANAILDRGWGKPQQDMTIEHRHSFVEALRELERTAREHAALGTGVAQIEDQSAPVRH